MKVFSWLQNKLSGCHGCKKSNSIATDHHLRKLQESRKEEFSNWPDELLAIGTFGNNDLKQHPEIILNPPHDRSIITSTNVPDDDDALRLEEALITSEEYLGKVEQLLNEEPIDMTNEDETTTTDHKSLVLPRKGSKDVDGTKKKREMIKRTVSFLLKKMFVCKSGFSTTRPLPSLRDPPTGDPRMEKILRTILNKKIHPQGSSQGTPLYSRRYIENIRHRSGFVDDEDELNEEAGNTVDKWVRTDSEYIVLEI